MLIPARFALFSLLAITVGCGSSSGDGEATGAGGSGTAGKGGASGLAGASGSSGQAGTAGGQAGGAAGSAAGTTAAGGAGQGPGGAGGAGAGASGAAGASAGQAGVGGAAGAVGGSGGAGGAGLGTLEVTPSLATLTYDLGGAAPTQAFQVTSTVAGQSTDVTSQCAFSLDKVALGSFTGAVLTAKAVGGEAKVTAVCAGSNGAADVVVKVVAKVVDGSAPAGAPGLFDGATPSAGGPTIEYPLANSVAPRNIPAFNAQWSAVAGADLFHLQLGSTFAQLDLYTTKREASPSEDLWQQLTASLAGQPLTFVTESLTTASPATKQVGAPVSMRLSTDSLDNTAIYWWSSSAGQILTQTFGQTSVPELVKGECTSCHSLSRAGTRIGYSRCVNGDCAQQYQGFMRFDVPTQTWNEVVNANGKTIQGAYSTFAPVGNPYPDDSQSAALVAMGSGGLELYNPDTGAVLPSNVATASRQGPSDTTRWATMPDWSPSGSQIAFASSKSGAWVDLSEGAIATMSYAYDGTNHAFGTPQLIVEGPLTGLDGKSYSNFFFPSYSPDGQWLIFNGARSAWRTFEVAASAGQRLFLTNPQGQGVVELANLNGVGDLDITWPHWAPSATSEFLWVVFASERDYGHLLNATNTSQGCVANGVKQCKQIWLSSIERSKLPAPGQPLTIDPSTVPVWLPGQEISANNISPYWSLPTPKP